MNDTTANERREVPAMFEAFKCLHTLQKTLESVEGVAERTQNAGDKISLMLSFSQGRAALNELQKLIAQAHDHALED